MVKSYLRYSHADVFGLISSTNAVFDPTGKFAITASSETISVWHIKQAIKVKDFKDDSIKSEVSIIALNGDGSVVAAGYADGAIRLWSYADGICKATLHGHKNEVSALAFSNDGATLVSGGRDTDINVWDVISETGLFKLRGHRDEITGCKLLSKTHNLISSSKDGLVKIWDMDSRHCVQTLVGHRSSVWSFDVNSSESLLVTGSTDTSLRVWKLGEHAEGLNESTQPEEDNILGTHESTQQGGQNGEPPSEEHFAKWFGFLPRVGGSAKDRVTQISFNKDGTLLGCQGLRHTEFFKVLDDEEVARKLAVRAKRRAVKNKNAEAKGTAQSKDDLQKPSDELLSFHVVRKDVKFHSFCFGSGPRNTRRVLFSLRDNSLEVLELPEDKDGKEKQITVIDHSGHRGDIRFVALSSDNTQILSVSDSGAKIWSSRTGQCIRTLDVLHGICGVFAPGDLHVIIGTRSGALEIVELASGDHKPLSAHTGTVWSLHLHPDKSGLVSASADHQVKIWSFSLDEARDFTLILAHVLEMETDALCARFSPNGKLLAVSLMDNTVKVFHSQTLKFFLSLYGHKLPVLSMDISSDSTLLATASSDKNVKLWGLDFGDCHKSIFAHDDSVMQVVFVPNTHYFFTCGKDRLVKQWDGDNFEHIQTLKGHHSEIWAMAISNTGAFLVTGSHDKSIRIWEQTEEPLFLEEERENALDAGFEASMEEDRRNEGEGLEHGRASRRTLETVKGSEKILDALVIAVEPTAPVAIATLGQKTPAEYLLSVMQSVRPSDLEEALLLLPYVSIGKLLGFIDSWLDGGSRAVELACRVLFFVLTAHQHQLALDRGLLTLLQRLNDRSKAALQKCKDVMGMFACIRSSTGTENPFVGGRKGRQNQHRHCPTITYGTKLLLSKAGVLYSRNSPAARSRYNRAALGYLKRTYEANTGADIFGELVNKSQNNKKKRK